MEDFFGCCLNTGTFGSLTCRRYIDDLCEEINDNLQEVGQMNVADISKSFALPNNFILEVILQFDE